MRLKDIRYAEVAALLIVIASFCIGIYLYPQMPEQMASHWDAAGNVNGYMAKFWGLFLMPLISLGLFALFMALPRIDPKRYNIAKFMKYFDGFIVLLMLFLLYIYALTLAWSFGITFDMIVMLCPALGVLFIYIGAVMGRTQQNWTFGIRTPWTMSSPIVWKKTHKRGALLFTIIGIIAILCALVRGHALYIFLAAVILAVAYLYAYSYFAYKALKRR